MGVAGDVQSFICKGKGFLSMNKDNQTMKTQEKKTRLLNLKAEDAGHCWENVRELQVPSSVILECLNYKNVVFQTLESMVTHPNHTCTDTDAAPSAGT